MADRPTGSFARDIDPDGGIKGPDLRSAFDKANDAMEIPIRDVSAPQVAQQIPSQQVANSTLTPREPAPTFGYDRMKAGQHVDAMRTDDRKAKEAAIQAKAQMFRKQDLERKAKGLPSLGKSFERGRERGDD